MKDMSENADREKDIVYGRNAVAEALKSGRTIDTLYVQRDKRAEHSGSVTALIAKARDKGIVIKEVDGKKLDFMCAHGVHQGVAALCAVKAYCTVDEILKAAEEAGEPPFVLICENIEDPHNLGAIIRTAEAAGVHGVIVPQRHAAPLSFAVGKASAGAVEYMRVARVVNITATIRELKEKGLWIYCADMDGTPYTQANLTGPAAFVVGSEGSGVQRLVKENCDFVLSVPMRGKVNSLNASVAAALLVYEAFRQRNA